MKIISISILLIILHLSCVNQLSSNINSLTKTNDSQTVFPSFKYDSLTIPVFFNSLIINHYKHLHQKDSSLFIEISNQYGFDKNDTNNLKTFYTLRFLNLLFTSQTASSCSKGDILKIPYMWHWVSSNPRHEIKFTENGQDLVKTKPPKEFSKYNSYADIDRTPFLYLSDLCLEKEKYYLSYCDTFSTFGWCSEREMAFIALSTLLDFNGKVVAEDNHSWSEVMVQMKTISKNKIGTGLKNFVVKIDNTFFSFDWAEISEQEQLNWKNKIGNSSLSKWYNQKAISSTELSKIKTFKVHPMAIKRIENSVVRYLNR